MKPLLYILCLILAACAPDKDKLQAYVRPDGSGPAAPKTTKTGAEYGKAHGYPDEWWAVIEDPNKPSWEILPQEAAPGEVILSKRNELGVLSNFAETPFVFKGKKYASLEGFWQATKFPEGEDDFRLSSSAVKYTHKREAVELMIGFDAKHAGDEGSTNMKLLGINWVTFEKNRMVYRETGESPFYQLIRLAMIEKLTQNRNVCELLKKTGDLKLRPDHDPGKDAARAWLYFDIWMELRTLFSDFDCSKI